MYQSLSLQPVLASYKSEGWLQILILIIFWGYTCFVLKIHSMYLNDITDLERTLEKDFKIINRDSGYNTQEVNRRKTIGTNQNR